MTVIVWGKERLRLGNPLPCRDITIKEILQLTTLREEILTFKFSIFAWFQFSSLFFYFSCHQNNSFLVQYETDTVWRFALNGTSKMPTYSFKKIILGCFSPNLWQWTKNAKVLQWWIGASIIISSNISFQIKFKTQVNEDPCLFI